MTLSSAELAERLGYPAIWTHRGLYPDALYRVQLAAFVSEYSISAEALEAYLRDARAADDASAG